LSPGAAVSSPPASGPVSTEGASGVPSQVIFKREQDATDAMPLTYREYVYLVPPGTSESDAETLLMAQLDLVRRSLDRVAPGKLVNLGVFDVAFQGKPSAPPIATLAWKDWRGAPDVTFPRRPGAFPARGPAVVPTPIVAVAAAPFAAAPLPALAPPAAVAFPAPAPVVAPAPAAVVAAPATGPIRTATPGTGIALPRRIRGEDLIAELFEAMHDLHFVRDSVEGGDFCLALAMEKLPSQAGMVHLYDINSREFLVSSVRGPSTSKLLMRRHAETDELLSAAMRKRGPVVFDQATAEAQTLERYAALGGVRSMMIAPVMQAGRFLGAIELVNPLDGQPFTEAEGNALAYIAGQFAEFVATRGIVIDAERASARNLPGS
jgi:GAF domain-containing protein